MPRRKPSIPRTTIDSKLSFSRKKDCKDHTIMLGVFHTYVPMVTNYIYQKVTADESQV